MLLFPPAIFCTGIVNSTVSATGASPLLFMVTWPSNDWAVTVQLSRFEVPSTVIELSGEKERVWVAACAFAITGAINKRIRRSEDSTLIVFIMALFNPSLLYPMLLKACMTTRQGVKSDRLARGTRLTLVISPHTMTLRDLVCGFVSLYRRFFNFHIKKVSKLAAQTRELPAIR